MGDSRAVDVFAGGGEVGRDHAAVDWSSTPLGLPDGWPQSLRTVVGMLLTSRFSMWMAWGPELTFFCNDAYRRDTLGTKYPWALGRSARDVWAEIWPDIGPRIETVLRTGEATWDEALLLFLERSGYREETYHTFSYSPLTDDDGERVGMLCVVTEDTERVIGERRMAILRDLGSDQAAVRTEREVFDGVRRHLGADQRTLPFTATYLFDEDTARLACATGMPAGHPVAPMAIPLGSVEAASLPWPVDEAKKGLTTLVELGDRFDSVPTGAWVDPPRQALVVPLPQQGQREPYGCLVVGVNPFRPCDEAYRGFVELVAGQVAAGIASARAYEAERARADALAELDRAKTAFFTNVSHEFRTPLTLLLGPAEDSLADSDEPLAAGQRERIAVVHRNAQRLLKLVNTLLDFSRLESGRLAATFEPVRLGEYTADLASTFRAAVERVGLTLDVACEEPAEPVYVDREMWAKIVLNLLSNALKFTFDGGLRVELVGREDSVELVVTDTGIGIEAADQAHLFERFHRITGARSRTHEGSGIGLALVAELASLHGGTVGVTSEPGSGTRFTVAVPLGSEHLSPDQVVDDAPSSSTAQREIDGFLAETSRWLALDDDITDLASTPLPAYDDAGAAPSGRLPRVLVVDDNADMRQYVRRLLGDRYDVELAHDGVDALARVTNSPPDLVLTDVMMPRLDGFGLLTALRANPSTAFVPVVMLSARAGDASTVEGLEAGADDYLVKPFSARELLARVRANLELDRSRRQQLELRRRQRLLEETQRIAGVGSWEVDLATGAVTVSDEYVRQVKLDRDELREKGLEFVLAQRVRPEDMSQVRAALEAAVAGTPLDLELQLTIPGEGTRIVRVRGEVEHAEDGTPVRLQGSNQDITDQRRAEERLAAAAAGQEAAAREHLIADQLQRSLLPEITFEPDHLRVWTYYQPGVTGTQVGGDWYDVIELGAGRTGLVMGDVMGRGVRAAAVMGQLRAAVRAYARLDLPPADVLEFLDGAVRELGEDQIVTCLYAVYDPGESTLTYANAGHLPPLLRAPGEEVRRLTRVAGPPLGAGPLTLREERVRLAPGSVLVLYTDGLVEHRDSDIDLGIERLSEALTDPASEEPAQPAALVAAMLRDDQDDDVAVLVAQVHEIDASEKSAAIEVISEDKAVQAVRHFVQDHLREWLVTGPRADDIVLLANELLTNAVVHGRPPLELRMRCSPTQLMLEVRDSASYLPRRLRPTPEDEHGRGIQLVAMLADRWGTRPVSGGKAVWCVVGLDPGEV